MKMSEVREVLPNKLYVVEETIEVFDGLAHYVILVTASDIDLAKKYVKEKVGIEGSITPVSGRHSRLFNQTGESLLKEQVKILYNGSFHTKFNNNDIRKIT